MQNFAIGSKAEQPASPRRNPQRTMPVFVQIVNLMTHPRGITEVCHPSSVVEFSHAPIRRDPATARATCGQKIHLKVFFIRSAPDRLKCPIFPSAQLAFVTDPDGA